MVEKFQFSEEIIKKHYQAAVKDLRLASIAGEPELVFHTCYNVVIKAAMAVCAKQGVRVKSRTGHHIELITILADAIKDDDLAATANKMRSKRNRDLYEGGMPVSEREAYFYLQFCRDLVKKLDDYLFPGKMI